MLMALRRRNNLDAILVTDDHGLLLAGAAVSGIDLDFLAATLAEPQPRDQIPNLATLTFKLDAPFHIGAIGSGPGLDSSLAEAVRGASRILAQ
jgi:chaperone required for assembly of F1-ATPase